jgi:hypothetical protein
VDNSTLITEGDINKLKKWPIPKLLNWNDLSTQTNLGLYH